MPRFGLIIVGDEILSGKRADKHMPKLIELLSARGLQLDYADYVGDSRDFHWQLELKLPAILDEIAQHASAHPEWLEVSRV